MALHVCIRRQTERSCGRSPPVCRAPARTKFLGEARECAEHPPDIRQSPAGMQGPRPCRIRLIFFPYWKNKRTQSPRKNAQGPERSVDTRTQTQPPYQPSTKARKLSPKATQCSGEKHSHIGPQRCHKKTRRSTETTLVELT